MRAVISVVGKDMVGILSKVSAICAANNVNIVEVSQSILQEFFCMIMVTDISKCTMPLTELSDTMSELGEKEGLCIHVMHEDIFNAMHRI